jgi:hypothetical protein
MIWPGKNDRWSRPSSTRLSYIYRSEIIPSLLTQNDKRLHFNLTTSVVILSSRSICTVELLFTFLVNYVKRVVSQESSCCILFEEWNTPSLPISNRLRTRLSDHSTTILQTQVQMSCNAVAKFNTTSRPWSFGSFETFIHVIFEDSRYCHKLSRLPILLPRYLLLSSKSDLRTRR